MALDLASVRNSLVDTASDARRPWVDGKADRPDVVKFGPESQTPIGHGKSWPCWIWLVGLAILIAVVISAEGWMPFR
jgi:hypothetical protein